MTAKFQAQAELVKKDPGVSNWLKTAVTQLLERDPVDAINDAELLHHLMSLRMHDLESKHLG